MKTALTCLLLFFIHHGFAQEPTFPISDASWVTTHISPCVGGTLRKYAWTEYLEGDTIIENKTYYKLMLHKSCIYQNQGDHCMASIDYPTGPDFAIGGVIEENGRVVFTKFDVPDSRFEGYERALEKVPTNAEIIFYDLNWETGDTVSFPYEDDETYLFEVNTIEEVNGKKKFNLLLKDGFPWENFDVVEGMGGTLGLFNMYYADLLAGEYLALPICFYHHDELIQEGEYCTHPCDVTATPPTPVIPESCVFPIPAIDQLNIDFNCIQSTSVTVEIKNFLTESLQRETYYHPGGYNSMISIPINDLPFGIYFLVMYSNDTLLGVRKFIVGE